MKSLLYFVVSTIIIFSNNSRIFAEDDVEVSDTSIVIIERDMEEPDFYMDKVGMALQDEAVDEVIVLDKTLSKNDEKPYFEEEFYEDEEAALTNPLLRKHPIRYSYRVANVKSGSDYTGSTALAVSTGQPGVTISVSQTKAVSNTFSLSISKVTAKTVTTAVGFNVTSTESIAVAGRVTVPKKVNGKNVKTMSLKAYTVYRTKNFDIQMRGSRMGVPTSDWHKAGTGTARKAYGCSFKKTYTYK